MRVLVTGASGFMAGVPCAGLLAAGHDVGRPESGVGSPRRMPGALGRLLAGPNAVTAVVRSARSPNARLRAELGREPRCPTAGEGVPDSVTRLRLR